MNYGLLIEERKSSRGFQDKPVPEKVLAELQAYHEKGCARLLPEISTELIIAGNGAKEKLESAAGYNEFLIGAPNYLVLLSEDADAAGLNAGYIMEDLLLKAADLGCGGCWLTFTDSDRIKAALSISTDKSVAAIAAIGLPEKVKKRIHLNIFSMSNVEISEKKRYFDPKKKIEELAFLDTYGSRVGLDEYIGFYDEVLWEALHAAADAPSYMNRQPYSFLIKDQKVYLLAEPDEVTGPIDRDLNLGVAMLHFAAVGREYIGNLHWLFGGETEKLQLPEGVHAVAYCEI